VARSKTVRPARWGAGTYIAVAGSLFWVSTAVCLVVVFVLALAVRRKNSGSWGAPRRCCRLWLEEACRTTAAGRNQKQRLDGNVRGMAGRGVKSEQGSSDRDPNLFSGPCYRRKLAWGLRPRSGRRNLSVSMVANLTALEQGLDPPRWRAVPALALALYRVLLFRHSLALRPCLGWGFEVAGRLVCTTDLALH
jgi:hypothetical protein